MRDGRRHIVVSVRTYRPPSTFHAFAEEDLQVFFVERSTGLGNAVRDEQENYLLNVNREDYLNHLVSRFAIEPLVIHADQQTITPEEVLVPAELFPRNIFVRQGESYARLTLTYAVPFSGPARLLRTQASTYASYTPSIWLEGQTIRFDFIGFETDPEQVRQSAAGTVDRLRTGAERVNHDIKVFNATLRTQAEQAFDQRKQQLLERRNFLAALKVPIQATNKTAATYSAPAPRRISPITPRPTVVDQTFRPDPTMDDVVYQQVLKLIHDVGVTFEKLPATYTGKKEEALRDHFLLALAPNFEGSVTGETFNKTGKTDILLRHEKSNLFVAECKFWTGPKGLLETIDQLLSYLTWRDSKAAVILFVRNVNFTDVIATTKQTIPTHPNHLGERAPQSESWLNYRFHINGDKSREVKLAVILFHLPPIDGKEAAAGP